MTVKKSAEAFRTISEAAKELDVPQHVLRHWEEVFGQIRPMRRAGGRRYYRPVDLDVLRGVRVLLYDERYTTKGVQKIFKENGIKYIAEIGRLSAAGEQIELRPLNEADTLITEEKPIVSDDLMSQFLKDLTPRLERLAVDIETAQDALDEAVLALESIDANFDRSQPS
ncbi:MAG: MerR family transcriptional regulator [Pseudomonadota bacterium]